MNFKNSVMCRYLVTTILLCHFLVEEISAESCVKHEFTEKLRATFL